MLEEDKKEGKEQGVIQDDIQNEYFQIVSKSKTFRLFCFQVSGSLCLSLSPTDCLWYSLTHFLDRIHFGKPINI